ncbi:hypothetical protein DITRI_Ditri20bG0127100 [Diplodiscus trichospermus]
MECLTAIVGTLVTEVAKSAFKQVEHHISYVFQHKRRVRDFQKSLQTLKERRDGVQRDADAADRNAEEIYANVTEWLKTVDDVTLDAMAKEVKDLEDKAEKKCFIGLCPNFKSRYQLSKRAEKDAKSAYELLQKGDFENISYRDVPPPIEFKCSENFDSFGSRKRVFNNILKALKDPSINFIVVYGMPGVGKTTLVTEIARQVSKEDKSFSSVVIAAVTQNPDIQIIQDQIAGRLGLKFEEQSLRASLLYKRLKKEKKILIVLDDIWAKLDLMSVGIPFGDEHMGCIVLITTRNLNALDGWKALNGREADMRSKFEIDVLSQEEAWDLFKKTAGNKVESHDLKSIANKIAKKCASLPIAITAVAKALRNKELSEWRNALHLLNKPCSINFGEDEATAGAYKAIELSYSYLKSKELQQTFLLCSLLGHNALIQDLLKYAIGLGLFQGLRTVQGTRDRLLTMLSRLKASCLLLDSYNNLCFDMHDLVSDVAISIISKDDRVFAVRHDEVLNEDDWPDGEKMKRCEKINLLSARINKLPCQLECPELTCFLVQRKDPSLKIPSEFFEKMRNLKVLDLTKFDFPSLPSSICLLANLRTLCLDQCVLGDISIIGELKNLEILSLLASDIEMLPKEIGQLIKLKLLDLSRCTRLKTIPPNILSCLSRLEELYMGNSFVQWEAEGHPSEQSNASLDELKALSSLTTLYVHIPNARMIPKDLSFEKLERYKVFIGEAWDWLDEIEYERTLKLKLHTNIGHLSRGMKLLLVKADNLYLDEMKDLEILLYMSEGRECFQRLKSLYVQKGALIQYIIGDNDVDKIEFLQLKSLTLHGLPKLISFCSQNRGSTSISTQELPLFNEKIVFPTLENLKLSSISIKRIWEKGSHSMQNLTSFILEGCSNLKHVLSYSMVECLQQLKCLEIIDCNSIQEIISREEIMKEGHGKTVSFPLLKSLKLKGLEKLIGFCHEDYIVEFQSLNILEIQHCPELKGFTINRSMGKDITTSSTSVVLFNEKAAFPNLEKITIAHLRNVSRIWYNQPYGDSFSRLKELEVEYCDNLLNIFSSYLMGVFQRLEMLRVTDCDSLEEVFNIEETCVEPIQLRELFLFHLPKMKHVWNKDPHGNISFQNLRVVKVRHCQSLKSLFPFSIAQGLLLLESLVVYWCRVEEIVSESVEGLPQEIRFQFNQLSFLMLWGLEDLKWFYPRQHSTVWPALTTLKTYKCEKIKIFGQGESQVQQPLFLIEKVIPRLQTVYFSKDDIATICDGQYATYFFGGIKVLGIIGFQFALLPSYFLQRFYELEILELVECSFEELPLCVGDVGEKKDMMETDQPKIKKLKLNGCFKMTRLWNQDSQLDHICASLETLQVWHCRDLINLAPASSSFRNLTTLDVWDCNEMAKLITSSKAQSLVCLVTMKLSECEMMTEIVSSEGDEATHEIIFRELKCLELHCLQSLKGFCSGNNIFTFPSLEDVTVSQCPRLKSFCKGDLSTPKLQKVFYQKKADYKGCWAGDLNATIQQLHEELHGEKIGYHGLKKLKFLESSELMDIWNRNPQEILDFKNLEFLEICNSNELRCILDLSLASNLGRLQQIEIKRSNKMEQVIKEADKAIADNEIINILPLLKFIVIESCPHLTSFYLGSTTLVFPSLESIEVVDCPNMTTFVSTLTREEHKEAKIADGPQRNKDDPDTPVAFFCDKIGDGTQRNKDDPDTRTAFFCDKDLELEQLDVKTVFLRGELGEEIYMHQPDGLLLKARRIMCAC